MSKKPDSDSQIHLPIGGITGRTAGNLPTGELVGDFILGPSETVQPPPPPPPPPAASEGAVQPDAGYDRRE